MQYKKIFIYLIACTLLLSVSCTPAKKNPLEEIYGADSFYYKGLSSLKENDTENARLYFMRCIEKGSYYPVRRSYEKLCTMGNVQDKLKWCSELIKNYDDEDASLFVCRVFSEFEEYAQVISITEGINLREANNALIKFRMEALTRRNDSRRDAELLEWFTGRRISQEHYAFYRENAHDEIQEMIVSENQDELEDFNPELQFIVSFRIAVFRGNYNAAFEMVPQVQEITLTKKSIPLTYQLVADLGRAMLNGSNTNIRNADFFDQISQMNFPHEENVNYYALIYSGLLCNKNDNYRRRALKRFEEAIQLSATDQDYDMALWYYLNSCLKISVEEAVTGLEKYNGTWHDADYFSDFFDALSVLCFSSGNWKSIGRVYELIKDCGESATVCKYAYLSARIIEAGYISGSAEQVQEMYRTCAASWCGTNVYYRLLACGKLGLEGQELDDCFFNNMASCQGLPDERKPDEEAEKLLLGYADFGLSEFIYPEWQAFFVKNKYSVGISTVERLAEFLQLLSDETNESRVKGLRMISRTANVPGVQLTRKIYELVYPRFFLNEVSSACQEFSVDEYMMFSLIRTESFFDPKVQSHAGAVGLTQLMEATAGDVARKLKVDEFDLLNPQINVRFGTYYISELSGRLNDKQILALFAYNAGIKTVRRWIQSSKIELDVSRTLYSDLFLETLPYKETRGYGRSVISGAAMYGWLYYGKNPCDIASTMM